MYIYYFTLFGLTTPWHGPCMISRKLCAVKDISPSHLPICRPEICKNHDNLRRGAAVYYAPTAFPYHRPFLYQSYRPEKMAGYWLLITGHLKSIFVEHKDLFFRYIVNTVRSRYLVVTFHHKTHRSTQSSPGRAKYGCLSWVRRMTSVLLSKLLCCVQYRVILHRDMSGVYSTS